MWQNYIQHKHSYQSKFDVLNAICWLISFCTSSPLSKVLQFVSRYLHLHTYIFPTIIILNLKFSIYCINQYLAFFKSMKLNLLLQNQMSKFKNYELYLLNNLGRFMVLIFKYFNINRSVSISVRLPFVTPLRTLPLY